MRRFLPYVYQLLFRICLISILVLPTYPKTSSDFPYSTHKFIFTCLDSKSRLISEDFLFLSKCQQNSFIIEHISIILYFNFVSTNLIQFLVHTYKSYVMRSIPCYFMHCRINICLK